LLKLFAALSIEYSHFQISWTIYMVFETPTTLKHPKKQKHSY